jgi:hypothetical protein
VYLSNAYKLCRCMMAALFLISLALCIIFSFLVSCIPTKQFIYLFFIFIIINVITIVVVIITILLVLLLLFLSLLFWRNVCANCVYRLGCMLSYLDKVGSGMLSLPVEWDSCVSNLYL